MISMQCIVEDNFYDIYLIFHYLASHRNGLESIQIRASMSTRTLVIG